MSGFFVLCGEGGIVREASSPSCPAGSPLVSSFAPDSRSKLMQLLVDGKSGVAHTVVQTSAGEAVDAYCAAAEDQALFILGTTTLDILRCCDELDATAAARPLAMSIRAAARPTELSFNVWEELTRLNNELATTHRSLAKSNAELRWLNEQKNELLGMAAHDLRNPLAAVLAYTSFLLEETATLSSDQIGMIRRIRSNVDTMLAMVEDVLDFTAIESGTVRLELVEIPVDAVIGDVIEVCRMIAARKQIRIVANVAECTVVVDRRKIAQVLTNLLTNAIKFSHPGSQISVSAGADPQGGAWISVADHGVGMRPEQVEKLFQPFERVGSKPTAGEKSTGLGLAIATRIVSAHHGRISVDSSQGEGSTFTVHLPPASPEVPRETEKADSKA